MQKNLGRKLRKSVWLTQRQQTGSKGGCGMRQDKAYWSEEFTSDFEAEGNGFSHYLDFT